MPDNQLIYVVKRALKTDWAVVTARRLVKDSFVTTYLSVAPSARASILRACPRPPLFSYESP